MTKEYTESNINRIKRYMIVIYDEPYSDAPIAWIELSYTEAVTKNRMIQLITQDCKTLELFRLADGAFYPINWTIKIDPIDKKSEIQFDE